MNFRPLLLVLLVAVCAAALIQYALSTGDGTVESSEVGERPARYELTQVRWQRLNDAGQIEFRAQAVRLRQYRDDSAELSELQLDALGGLDSPWRVRAPSGTVPSREQRIRLNGPVIADGRLTPNEPAQVIAENLWVDSVKKELSTDEPVRVETPTRSARARGLRTDFKGRQLNLLHDVEVTYAHTP